MARVPVCFMIASLTLLPAPCAQIHAQTSAPTFTSSTELVLIPAVIHDKSGVHISGLTKEQFVLKQDGKSQAIAVFEEVKTDSARPRRAEGEHGTFSNVSPANGDHHRVNIIVLDFVNTPFADVANARSELHKFLSEVAQSGEPMGLLALTRGGLTLLHDFTDDPKILAEALRKADSNTAPLIHESTVDPERRLGRNAHQNDQGRITNGSAAGLDGGERVGFHHRPGVAADRKGFPRLARAESADLGEFRLSLLVESSIPVDV